MSNTILTDSIIAKESLRLLENNLVFSRGVNRQYEKSFGQEHKIGNTINVRVPAQYTVRTGAVASIQDHTDSTVPVVVNTQKGVDVQFSSQELALSLEDFSENVLAPQIATLAAAVDFDGLSLYKSVPNYVGTLGTDPATLQIALKAGQKLDENAAPFDENRNIILNPAGQVAMVNGLSTLFNSQSQLKNQYEKGQMGTAAGFDWAMSQNIPTHTVGAYVGTPVTSGSATDGQATVATSGWTGSVAGLLKQGDVVTFAGVYAVNPYTKQALSSLKQFVITADVASSSGLATLPIYPAMILAGAKQNVSALPAGGAAIVVMTGTASQSGAQNLAYHKDAFTLVTVDLPIPKGMDMGKVAASKKAGLSIRFVRGYDITNDRFISRLDVLYGWKAIRPELACRIAGA